MDIVGYWEIEKYLITFLRHHLILQEWQNIVIKKDGSFEKWKHDTLAFEGFYFIQRKRDCSQRDNDIIFSTNENSSDSYSYVDVENGKLALSTPNCNDDGWDNLL